MTRSNHSQELQEIYLAILNVAKESSKILNQAADNIKKALELLLRQHYQNNQALLRDIAANYMNPEIAKNMNNPQAQRLANSLQHIHQDIAKTNANMPKTLLEAGLLGHDMPVAAAKTIQQAQENILQTSLEINEKTKALLQQKVMLTGDTRGIPLEILTAQKNKLDQTIKQFNILSQELKQAVKNQSQYLPAAAPNKKPRP